MSAKIRIPKTVGKGRVSTGVEVGPIQPHDEEHAERKQTSETGMAALSLGTGVEYVQGLVKHAQ